MLYFILGRTTNVSTLFTYVDGESWDFLNNLTFIPLFLEDLIQKYEGTSLYADALEECGSDRVCLFDTLATTDLSFGANTKATNDNNNENAEQLGKLLFFCMEKHLHCD